MRNFFLGMLAGVLVVPLVAGAAALCGMLPTSATSDPPAAETWIARKSLLASVSRRAPQLQSPIASTSETLRQGMKFYRDGCAGCHGDAEKPSHWGASCFYPRVPQFGTNPPPESEAQIFWIVKYGIRNSGMGASDGEVPDEEIWKVSGFLSHLRSLPPEIDAEWRHPPAR